MDLKSSRVEPQDGTNTSAWAPLLRAVNAED